MVPVPFGSNVMLPLVSVELIVLPLIVMLSIATLPLTVSAPVPVSNSRLALSTIVPLAPTSTTRPELRSSIIALAHVACVPTSRLVTPSKSLPASNVNVLSSVS